MIGSFQQSILVFSIIKQHDLEGGKKKKVNIVLYYLIYLWTLFTKTRLGYFIVISIAQHKLTYIFLFFFN